ncbi:MAG: FAD binding domain-containing protein [Phycisphaeraceae bacterium]|nr:FAD binding domain-containing protein [Phycisphaeraceae bacterium]
MSTFAIAQPKSFEKASELVRSGRYTLPQLKGAGLDILDHVKEGLESPDLLVNLAGAREPSRAPVRVEGQTIRIESGATLAQIAESADILRLAPVLAHAVGNAATPAVRHVATAAGNLLQRPRCWYYRNHQFECLKKGGATCFAVEGENRYHAIFGPGPCHIVHPSNLAPALMVCEGQVHVIGGQRASLPVAALFHTPDKGIRSEHNLEPGEVITHITLAARPASGFSAVKEKQSFDWPLAFACASLDIQSGVIRSAKVCAGAVAPVPWPLPAVEAALAGVAADDDAAIMAAAALAARGAKPMTDNAYKVSLLKAVVRRAVVKATGRTPEGLA